MLFMSVLSSATPRERGVQFIGSDAHVTKSATDWLESSGEHGDEFTVYEVVRQPLRVIKCDKPKPPPPGPKAGHHAFVESPYGSRCQKCSGTVEAHL